MDKLLNVIMRIAAVFAASGLSVVGMGTLVGLGTIQSILLAGGLGVATVIEALARGYLDDGKLSNAEINAAFAQVDKKGRHNESQ
jgi:hypothetical protein